MAKLEIDLDRLLIESGISQAVIDVANERFCQVTTEGWTHAHDDQHNASELAEAAMALLQSSLRHDDGERKSDDMDAPFWWPKDWWPMKRKDQRSDLVRAGALVLAEIERLDRAKAAATREKPDAPG